MESISQTIDRVFPKTVDQAGPVTIAQLAQMKDDVKKALPDGSVVEITLFMNSILLSCYVQGEGWLRRSCTANIT